MKRLVAAALAAAAVASIVPERARNVDLPSCIFASGSGARGATGRPHLTLRVASIPRNLTAAAEEMVWVFTVTNRTNRPRSLGFADSGFAEVQLWRDGRRVYSWYDRNIHLQAFWGRVVPARSSWSCVQKDDPHGLEPGRYTLVAQLRNHGGSTPWYSREMLIG